MKHRIWRVLKGDLFVANKIVNIPIINQGVLSPEVVFRRKGFLYSIPSIFPAENNWKELKPSTEIVEINPTAILDLVRLDTKAGRTVVKETKFIAIL